MAYGLKASSCDPLTSKQISNWFGSFFDTYDTDENLYSKD